MLPNIFSKLGSLSRNLKPIFQIRLREHVQCNLPFNSFYTIIFRTKFNISHVDSSPSNTEFSSYISRVRRAVGAELNKETSQHNGCHRMCFRPQALQSYFNPVRKNIKFGLVLTTSAQTTHQWAAWPTFSLTTHTSGALMELFQTYFIKIFYFLANHIQLSIQRVKLLYPILCHKMETAGTPRKGQKYLQSGVFSSLIVHERVGAGWEGWDDLTRISFILYLLTHALLCAISVRPDQASVSVAHNDQKDKFFISQSAGWSRFKAGLYLRADLVKYSSQVIFFCVWVLNCVMQSEHKLYCSSLSISQSRNHGRKRNFLS